MRNNKNTHTQSAVEYIKMICGWVTSVTHPREVTLLHEILFQIEGFCMNKKVKVHQKKKQMRLFNHSTEFAVERRYFSTQSLERRVCIASFKQDVLSV